MSSKRKVSLAQLHKKLGLASARSVAVSSAPQSLPQQRLGLIGLLPPPAPDQAVPVPIPTAVKADKEVKDIETAPQKRPRQEIDLQKLPESKDVMIP
jgi:hypothetical protein